MRSFFDAVFFDMDGLLVDSEPEWLKSESEITAAYGYQWTSQDQVACLGGPLSRVGQYMHDKCNQAETPGFFTNKLVQVQSERMRSHTPFMPGAYELVKDLQKNGVKTGLVSASPRTIVDAVLDNVGAATSSGAWLVAVPHLVQVDESERVRVIKSLEQLNFAKIKKLYEDFSISI